MSSRIERIACEIRKSVVRMHRVGPNVGSSMSIADLLAVLYFHSLHIPSPDDPDRDRFILSKGHAVSALYATLSLRGFFDRGLLDQYLDDNGPLCGHPLRGSVPGIEATTGSLGHGLPIGIGMAMAAREDGRGYRVFVLCGDGECQEGSVWEGAMMAARFGLDNLVVIIDANGLQGYEEVGKIMPTIQLAALWRAFGWRVLETDGHDIESLKETFDAIPQREDAPTAIIARTVKGKGIREMEGVLGWHYFSIPEEKLASFLLELDEEG